MENGVFLVYEYGGGMDIYRDGDQYGHRIEIDSTGGYVFYERIYREQQGDQSVQHRQLNRGVLEKETLDTLKAQIRRLDLSKLPDRLPDVDPRKVSLMQPAESVSLTIKSGMPDEQSVRSYMGADSEHYPEEFLGIHRFLRQLVRSKAEHISE